jgi:hypothetical protein
MENNRGVLAREPVAALSDVTEFLGSVEQLKSLVMFKIDRLTRESRLLISIDQQIAATTAACAACARQHPRLTEMWRQVQAEVQEDLEKLSRLA